MSWIRKPKPGKKKWKVFWRDPGCKNETSRTVKTKEDAERLQAEVDEDLALGRPWKPRVTSSEVDLDGSMTAFITDKSRTLESGTLLRYARALEMFRRMLGEDRLEEMSAANLNKALLREFWTWLRVPENGLHGKQRSEDTARKNVEVIQLFWEWAFNEDAGSTVPPLKPLDMPRGQPKVTVAPTWAEMDACVAATLGLDGMGRQRSENQALYRLAVLLRFTGLRAQQAAMLLWTDFDFNQKTLHVTTGKTAQEKRGRIIPVSEHLLTEMSKWTRSGDYVIRMYRDPTSPRARVPRPREMERAWERAVERYKVRTQVFEGRPHHSFRKGLVSGLKRLGADVDAVEYLVGHSLGLRGVYTDPDAMPLRDAVGRIPPLDMPPTSPPAVRCPDAVEDGGEVENVAS